MCKLRLLHGLTSVFQEERESTVFFLVDLTEISPTILRGRLVTIQQFAIVFGISVALLLCYAGTYIPNEAAWR